MNSPSFDIKSVALKKDWVDKAFPVPGILIPTLTSIDISDGNLRFFEFSRKRGVFAPKDYGCVPFPRTHLGENNEKGRSEAISALKSWATAHECSSARAIIHEDEVYVFKVTVPTTDKNEIRPAIEALLEENVPIPPSDCIFEYEALAVDYTLKETTLAVSVVSKKSVGEYLDIFSSAGITVAGFETEARAMARALFTPQDLLVHAVLYIAEHHSVVFIVEKGTVVWSSSLEVGSADLDKAIAKTLGTTPEAARALKLEKAFTETDGDISLFEAMLPVFSTIRDELGKILSYWKSQSKKERDAKEITDVVLIGRDTMVAGFPRYISLISKLPAKTGSVWTNVLSVEEKIPELSRRDSLDFGTVIGSLL